MENMIKKIEDGIIRRLKTNLSVDVKDAVKEFDIGKGFADLLSYPAVSVTTEKITPEKIRGGAYELSPTVSIYMMFKAQKPDLRRGGVYPMVAAAAALLYGCNLSLDIDPLEPAGDIVEIFHQSLAGSGIVAFRMDVKTAFNMDVNDDEETTRLVLTANTYYYNGRASETQTVAYPNPDAMNYVP